MFLHKTLNEMNDAYNLRRLFVFRSAVMLSELLMILLVVYGLQVQLPVLPMLAVMALYGVFHVLVWLRLRQGNGASAREFFLHLCIDVLALAALFYYSGGSANPFVSLFLLPLMIVAITLPRSYVWAMALMTLACYSLLMVVHVPLDSAVMHGNDMQAGMMAGHNMSGHSMHGGAMSGDTSSGFAMHVLGMWFSFLLGVGVILFFVVSLAEELRRRDRHLAEIREKNMRDEHVIALGTMAAGAAHELGTPLATMAVLTKEMTREYAGQPELVAQLALLRSQVDRCKASLSQISANAGQFRAEGGRGEQLDAYLEQLLSQWRTLHADTEVELSMQGSQPAPKLVVDETLNQAIINLLNNAVDSSPEKIQLKISWTADTLNVLICDFGEGVSPEIMPELGRPSFTTKKEGHGLGLFLAQAVIRRLGGEVHIANRPEGGADVSISLPLRRLAASA